LVESRHRSRIQLRTGSQIDAISLKRIGFGQTWDEADGARFIPMPSAPVAAVMMVVVAIIVRAMPVVRARMPVMRAPVMMTTVVAMMIMPVMAAMLHIRRKAGGILHGAGDTRSHRRCRLGLLAGSGHKQQPADGEKAQNLRKVHF